MSSDKRDILEVLKFELNFLEQGGYGRSVRTPWKPTSQVPTTRSGVETGSVAVHTPLWSCRA